MVFGLVAHLHLGNCGRGRHTACALPDAPSGESPDQRDERPTRAEPAEKRGGTDDSAAIVHQLSEIGFFGFGGGYAMLSLIQNEVVVQHGWMTNAEFADIVAVSQITPGPIAINSATYVGYTVGTQAGGLWMGIVGAFIATFAVCLPALTLMLLITRFFLKLKDNPIVVGSDARGCGPWSSA